eukprot:PhM_4_TR10695/c0_g1_i1/m.69226/K15292/STXBP1, MUNC18-1; syntaxin-binding protein 1
MFTSSASSPSSATAAGAHAADPNIPQGIRTYLRKKVISCLQQVPGEWKVLILDKASAGVLASGMKVHDLMEYGVTLIEDIQKARQPLPRSPAVYFLSTDDASVDKAIADWSGGKTPYQSAHILLTNRVGDDVVRKISSSPMGPHLKSLKEVLIEFTILDRFAFRTNTPQDLFKFFVNNDTRDVHKTCAHVASLLHTLQEVPTVRYQNTPVARTFAMQLSETLDLLTHLDPSYTTDKSNSGGSVVLIVDRGVDCCGPLMHELTYNCFLQDVFPLDHMKYKHQMRLKDGATQEKDMILDDHDSVWMQLHHMHIADAGKEVDKAFADFRDANAVLSVVGKKGSQVTTSQLADAVHAMPQMQDKITRFSMHMDILRRLNIIFRESQLEPVVALEQRMATGEMEDGTKTAAKDIENDLQKILKDDQYSPEVKQRLLLLFVITQGLPSAARREQLIQMAQLSTVDDTTIDNITKLGVKLTSERKLFGRKRPKRLGAVKEGAYDLSRYETALKAVMESLAKDTLSNTEYPFVKEPPSSSKASASTMAGARSLRAGASWALGGGAAGGLGAGGLRRGGNERQVDLGHGGAPLSVSGQKLFVFVVGGVTNAEIRGAHEIMVETKREVYIGGTSLQTPASFIQQLALL